MKSIIDRLSCLTQYLQWPPSILLLIPDFIGVLSTAHTEVRQTGESCAPTWDPVPSDLHNLAHLAYCNFDATPMLSGQ